MPVYRVALRKSETMYTVGVDAVFLKRKREYSGMVFSHEPCLCPGRESHSKQHIIETERISLASIDTYVLTKGVKYSLTVCGKLQKKHSVRSNKRSILMRSSLIGPHPASPLHSAHSQAASYAQQSVSLPQAPGESHRHFLMPIEGWLPLLLLAVAVYSVVYSVTAAIAINHNTILWIMTACGLFCGLLVAKSRYLPQFIMHMGACLLGYWLALFATSFLAYHVPLITIFASLHSAITSGFTLSDPLANAMVFLFYLAFLCFFLGYFGSWLIYRAHLPWLVALVYISIMLVNLNYIAKRDLSFLVIILVGALILLIARMQLANQLAMWKQEGLYTDAYWLRRFSTRFLCIAILFALLILPFSWLLPAAREPAAGTALWNNLDNAWANVIHGHLPSLNNPGALFSPYDPPTNFFGDQLTISGSVNLPHGPVLSYVSTSSLQGQYLEGFTFDTFDGHTWTAQMDGPGQAYGANDPLLLDNSYAPYHQLVTSITMLQPPGGTRSYIFAPTQPVNFTVPIILFTSNGGNFAVAWTKSTSFHTGEHYQVTSAVSTATPADLSAIPLPGTDKGFWQNDPNYQVLQQEYLQKPGDLSPEVLATARAWTQGANNMYDAVIDLQNHFNNTADFIYSVTNPAIPANIDAVTWLLHTHQGYCTHYATAMVMMARLLGIPARLVNGFSQGHYDLQQRSWIVDGSDAHSWVQIYFPNFGWINFDPTPGFSLARTRTPSTVPPSGTTKTPISSNPTVTTGKPRTRPPSPPTTSQKHGVPSTSTQNDTGQSLFLTTSLLILLSALILLGFAVTRYRNRHISPLTPVASVYARLCHVAALLGSPPALWQTPYEYTFTLSRRFPQASVALRRLADLFVRERWATPQHAVIEEKQELQQLWLRLRNILLRSPFTRNRSPR